MENLDEEPGQRNQIDFTINLLYQTLLSVCRMKRNMAAVICVRFMLKVKLIAAIVLPREAVLLVMKKTVASGKLLQSFAFPRFLVERGKNADWVIAGG